MRRGHSVLDASPVYLAGLLEKEKTFSGGEATMLIFRAKTLKKELKCKDLQSGNVENTPHVVKTHVLR